MKPQQQTQELRARAQEKLQKKVESKMPPKKVITKSSAKKGKEVQKPEKIAKGIRGTEYDPVITDDKVSKAIVSHITVLKNV